MTKVERAISELRLKMFNEDLQDFLEKQNEVAIEYSRGRFCEIWISFYLVECPVIKIHVMRSELLREYEKYYEKYDAVIFDQIYNDLTEILNNNEEVEI